MLNNTPILKKLTAAIALTALVALLVACTSESDEPTPTPTATPTLAPAPSPTFTAVPSSTPTPVSSGFQPPTESPTPSAANSDVAEDGDRVAVHYEGTLNSGEVFDESRGRGQPLEFVLGSGQMIEGFDAAVGGMKIGEMKTVQIPPAEAYGERTDDLILELPSEGAPEGLQVGDSVRLSNGATVTILEINADVVLVDANHPLAGETLTFEIELMSIQKNAGSP